ncbi:hypothetical protein L3Q82_006519 [Scortum barcoo]|uniref:Uncharacterized protein n=1 Tax=Scortum barcoo TaxID=214431 RepID=A0ACB8WZG4_9TELE|nr:hypothetical protein L3Q82_006519 [Scortum barcoo]
MVQVVPMDQSFNNYAGIIHFRVNHYGSKVKLVRITNPWGRQEWNGKWSDKSDLWNKVSPEDQEKCFDREDGEFWDLTEQHSLQPGEYMIVPSTMKPYMSAEFVLTVYSKTETKISPHDGDDDDDHDHEEILILPEIPTDEDVDKEDPTDKDLVHEMFNRYANQSDELSARQLQKLLNDYFPHGTWRGFGLDTCRSIIAIVDKLFHRYDLSQSGSLSEHELSKAIEGAGMNASNGLVTLMMFRYSGFSSTSLEEFITLMLNLEKTSMVRFLLVLVRS